MVTHRFGKLWILEDQSDLRTILAYLARGEGFEVLELESLAQAGAALANEAGEGPRFILSDLALRDGNAEEWIFRARERFPGARIACLSGSLNAEIIARFSRRSIMAIEKPVSLLQVIHLLRMAI